MRGHDLPAAGCLGARGEQRGGERQPRRRRAGPATETERHGEDGWGCQDYGGRCRSISWWMSHEDPQPHPPQLPVVPRADDD